MNHAIRVAIFVSGLVWFAACDPVQDRAIAALGGEVAGVDTGPLHRPGQPCLLCHDGALGDPPEFSVAGTVFVDRIDKKAARGATVTLKAADGTSRTFKTNEAGNFYVTPQSWRPAYPLEVSVDYQSQSVSMISKIGRDGSCAGCHVDPASASSAGHVYAIPDDAGVAP
jgi:hypothetical protein